MDLGPSWVCFTAGFPLGTFVICLHQVHKPSSKALKHQGHKLSSKALKEKKYIAKLKQKLTRSISWTNNFISRGHDSIHNE
ncbi:hypothetical protein ACOSP7_025028 [Xanthoceras sorbifolium]